MPFALKRVLHVAGRQMSDLVTDTFAALSGNKLQAYRTSASEGVERLDAAEVYSQLPVFFCLETIWQLRPS